jgi:hypothetical protein
MRNLELTMARFRDSRLKAASEKSIAFDLLTQAMPYYLFALMFANNKTYLIWNHKP